ncbi:MAG: TolC family protein [Chthonomonadales bacterium]
MSDPDKTNLILVVVICTLVFQASTALADGAPKAAAPSTVLTAHVGPQKISVEQAVRIGLERNPQIAGARAAEAAARANYRSFAAFPGVQLGVTHSEGTSTAPSLTGAPNDTFLDVGETLDTSGQRRYQAAGAGAQWTAARYALEEMRLSLEQQIRDAYWGLAAARAQSQAALDALHDVEKVHELTITQEQAGASPHADVVRSSIDVANARQAYEAALGAERVALAALNTLLARPAMEPLELEDALSPSASAPEPIPNLPDLKELQRIALENRPLIRQAREATRSARYAVLQAKASRFPDVSVDYERSLQHPAGSETVLLGAHFPILDFGSINEAIRSAAAAERQAKAQEVQTEQQVAQQVAQAWSDYVQARKIAASYREEVLEPSVRLLEMARIGYQQGATGILPVIDAETTLRNARIGAINALLALYKARDEVYAATGGLSISPSKEVPK